MKNHSIVLIVSVFIIACSAEISQAAVSTIDFDQLVWESDLSKSNWDPAQNQRNAPYIEDGYKLTTFYKENGILPTSDVFFTSVHSGSYFYAGSVSFITHYSDDYAILSKNNGELFDLISIDLDSLYGSTSHVEFTGIFEDGSTITQAFYLDGNRNNMETFFFTDFTNLVSVSWDNLESASLHHYDNIVLSSVPIPSSIFLLGFGLLIWGCSVRKIKFSRPAER